MFVQQVEQYSGKPFQIVKWNISKNSNFLAFLFLVSEQWFSFSQDVYDRAWWPYQTTNWTERTTSSTIETGNNDYQPPLLAMRSACVPANASLPLTFPINSTDPKAQYYVIAHFAEIEKLEANQSREFNIYINGKFQAGPYSPNYLMADTFYTTSPFNAGQISIEKTTNSTLPPILNAIEMYTVKEFRQLQTVDTEGIFSKTWNIYAFH